MTLTGADFAQYAVGDWQTLVDDALGGRDPGVLVSHSDDGIAVGPLYLPAAARPLPARHDAGPWTVVQRIDRGQAGDALAELKADRDGGVAHFEIVFDRSPTAHGAGLPAASVDEIARPLPGLDCRGIRVDGGEDTPALARQLRATAPEGCEIASAFDPIATLAARGYLLQPFEAHAAAVAAAGQDAGTVVIADGRIWHCGGATEAQELAAVLATLIDYLRLFGPADAAASSIGVALSADADQFMTIAKFRAMRLLHARLLEAADLPPSPARIHAGTSWRMLSRLDPHTNILRIASAVFAAGIGGADSVTALPFDAALGSADPFARRIARNSQSILIAESGLGHVADPGAGSGAIEHLSRELAAVAWDLFRGIERDGGMLAAVRAGTIQRAIAGARDERLDRVRRNQIELVGINVYPDPSAKPLPPLPDASPPPPADAPETAEALRFVRLAEPVEEGAGR